MSPGDELPFAPLEESFEVLGDEIASQWTEIIPVRDRRSGKKVAIQRLRNEISHDKTAVARFDSDAKRARDLVHPSIVRVFDVARDAQSTYCVVEWPEYGTLAHRLEEGPLTEREAFKFARAIAEALRFAHGKKIMHGHVRPSNVVFSEDGGVRLAGFGMDELGSLPGPAVRPDPYELGADLVEKGKFDPSADVFAFGGMLYHMVTGEAPFSVALGLVPQAFRELIRDCIALKRSQRLKDFDEVLAILRRAEPAGEITIAEPTLDGRSQSRGERTAAPFSQDGPRSQKQAEKSSDALDLTNELSAPAQRDPSRAPSASGTIPPSRGGALQSDSSKPSKGARSGSSGSAGDTRSATFPYRPADELYEIVGDPMMGGMGSVHKAVERATGRYVAIKRIHAQNQLDPGVIVRFHREAMSIAKLSHPHILQLLQPARDDEGDYLVLEWAAGGSLVDKLKAKGKLGVEETLHIARKIGAALGYAHSKGVIHRDIKPHNILLTEGNEPKLADFGLVRSMDEHSVSTTRGAAGTLLYMAPEQWVEAHAADARSDIYSLGKTLYHLLTGVKPVTIDPEKIPQEIRSVVMRCLEEKPERRFQTVDELLAQIEPSSMMVGSSGLTKVLGAILLLVVVACGAAWWKRDLVKDWLGVKNQPTVVHNADGTTTTTIPLVDASKLVEEFNQDRNARRAPIDELARRCGNLDSSLAAFKDATQEAEAARVTRMKSELAQLETAIERDRRAVDGTTKKDEFAAIDSAIAKTKEELTLVETAVSESGILFAARRSAERALMENDAKLAQAAGLVGSSVLDPLTENSRAQHERLARLHTTFATLTGESRADFDKLGSDASDLANSLRDAVLIAAKSDSSHDGSTVDARIALLESLEVDVSEIDALKRSQSNQAAMAGKATQDAHAALFSLDSRLGVVATSVPLCDAVKVRLEAARGEIVTADAALKARRISAAIEAAKSATANVDAAQRALEDELVARIDGEATGFTQKVVAATLLVLKEIAPQNPRLHALERRASFAPVCPDGFEVVVARHGVSGLAQIVRHRKSGIEFALVEPGEFVPTSSAAATPSRVRISKPFYIARTETTVEQYRRFVMAADNPFRVDGDDFPLGNPFGTASSKGAEYGDAFPVVRIRQEQADRFCKWAGDGLRLPSEAEWEFAARSGSGSKYWWGDARADMAGRENVLGPSTKAARRELVYGAFEFEDGATYLAPAGSFKRFGFNANLLFDTVGNASEWCADAFSANPYAGAESFVDPLVTVGDGSDPESRVVRGGNWKSNPDGTSCATRMSALRSEFQDTIGFRVAITP